MNKLYKLTFSCGREGDIEGIFVATQEEIGKIIGKDLYFSEPFGKHSEAGGPLEEEEISIITDDQDFIAKFQIYIGNSVGYNPLHYLAE